MFRSDAIDKYFDRPRNDVFEEMSYPDYFRNYNIANKPPGLNSKLYVAKDLKNRVVIRRTKPLLLRFMNYKVDDGEPFFFSISSCYLLLSSALREIFPDVSGNEITNYEVLLAADVKLLNTMTICLFPVLRN